MSRHIALFMYGLTGGGVARRMVTLANELAVLGDRVDLLLVRTENRAGIAIDQRVRVIGLPDGHDDGWWAKLAWGRKKRWRAFRGARSPLADYLRSMRPDVLIAADLLANLTALEARERARHTSPLIVTQRTHTSTFLAGKFARRHRKMLIREIQRLYPKADAVVGVSKGVSADLVSMGLPAGLVRTIYNPVIGPKTEAHAAEPIDHPWFQEGAPPVILGVGRLTPQKDFSILVKAFARLIREGRDLRLVIVGAGRSPADESRLSGLASRLGIQDRFDLPGSVANPFAYMAKSALIACSSRWEGLPAMLIEALAVGTPAVSTDCPSGPREVLQDGALGRLVPVGDDQALADAIMATLDHPPDPEGLIRSAERFRVQASVDAYSTLIDDLRTHRRAA